MNNKNPKITKLETLEDVQKFILSRQKKSEKGESGLFYFCGMFILISYCLFYFLPGNNLQKKAPPQHK